MSLRNERVSVLQPWVMELPLREQGTLLTAVRGCDLTPKNPLDSIERQLVACLRYAFMVPADPREVGAEPGAFFQTELPKPFKPSGIGHYPLHWISHVMHAAEVVAYRHPSVEIKFQWLGVYLAFCKNLHVNPETWEQFTARLSEDRVASGEIVQ